MPRSTNLPTLATVLAFTTLPIFAIAQGQTQTADEQRWYKVELLVFSNESTASSNAEQWEATPKLAYPQQTRFLVDEALYASRADQYQAQDQIDSNGRQQLIEPASAGTGADLNPGIPDQENSAPVPTPFITLPAAQQEFADKAARMRRGGRYSVLFHETWVQPVQAESVAVPITLDRSGDTLEWPRLQGSIKLHLSRYLHIKTNLWLNTQGSYLSGSWKMPAPPLSPPSLLGDAFADFEEKKLALAEASGALKPVPMPAVSGTAIAADAPPGTPIPGLPTGLPSSQETAMIDTGIDQTQQELAPQYPFRHAVLLRQSRKMRSNEVHYIDHPMLGVIVKFTPQDEEDLKLLVTPAAAP